MAGNNLSGILDLYGQAVPQTFFQQLADELGLSTWLLANYPIAADALLLQDMSSKGHSCKFPKRKPLSRPDIKKAIP